MILYITQKYLLLICFRALALLAWEEPTQQKEYQLEGTVSYKSFSNSFLSRANEVFPTFIELLLLLFHVVTSGGRSPSDWVVSIQNKQLMIDPHCETGSQDVVVISAASESLITLHEVTALRFLLRQPSPNWKNFNINGITVYNLFN